MQNLETNNDMKMPKLNKKKIKSTITLSELLISNLLIMVITFGIVYLFCRAPLITESILPKPLPLKDIVIISLLCFSFVKIYSIIANIQSYDLDILDNITIKSKITNIINPSRRKQSENIFNQFSEIGYYFNEDISFIEKNIINGLLSFQDNTSLKKYIELVTTDSQLSEQLSKIIMVSKDIEFKKLQDVEIKSLVISEVFIDLVKLSIPKIIEYNQINEKSKIEMTFDNYYTNDLHKDLEKLRITNRKLFKKLNSENYSFTNPDILNIFTNSSILEKSKGLAEVNTYVLIFKEFNKYLEDVIKKKEDTHLKKLNSNVDSLKEIIIGKYNLI